MRIQDSEGLCNWSGGKKGEDRGVWKRVDKGERVYGRGGENGREGVWGGDKRGNMEEKKEGRRGTVERRMSCEGVGREERRRGTVETRVRRGVKG